MVFAIIGAYWNLENSLRVSGLAGSGFLLTPTVAVTCHHVLNTIKSVLAPAPYERASYWIVTRTGTIAKIEYEMLRDFPKIDTTIIRFKKPVEGVEGFRATTAEVRAGEPVHALGYSYGERDELQATLHHSVIDSDLRLDSADMGKCILDIRGTILHRETISVDGGNFVLKNIPCLRLGFNTIVGMSGGPILRVEDATVCGMNAWGYPPDVLVKTKTYAIAIEEVVRRARLKV